MVKVPVKEQRNSIGIKKDRKRVPFVEVEKKSPRMKKNVGKNLSKNITRA